MPSPFPGMDPYLENPARWQGFHNALIYKIMSQLNARIVPRYAAVMEERVYITDQDDLGRPSIIPDVHLLFQKPSEEIITVGGQTMAAVVEPIEVELIDDEIHDTYLTILNLADEQVVTVIEVLSPTNKIRGSRGQEQFLKKRAEVLASSTHWVEIDLLRQGDRFVPPELAGLGDYFISVSRSNVRNRKRVWPIKMPQPIPVVAIPLLGNDSVSLDVQAALGEVYDETAYRQLVKYRGEATPPLPSHYTAWADELLKAKGLRS